MPCASAISNPLSGSDADLHADDVDDARVGGGGSRRYSASATAVVVQPASGRLELIRPKPAGDRPLDEGVVGNVRGLRDRDDAEPTVATGQVQVTRADAEYVSELHQVGASDRTLDHRDGVAAALLMNAST